MKRDIRCISVKYKLFEILSFGVADKFLNEEEFQVFIIAGDLLVAFVVFDCFFAKLNSI